MATTAKDVKKKKVAFASDHTYRYDPNDTPSNSKAEPPLLFAKTLNMFVKQKGTQKQDIMYQQPHVNHIQESRTPSPTTTRPPSSASPQRNNNRQLKNLEQEKTNATLHLQDEINNQFLHTMSNKAYATKEPHGQQRSPSPTTTTTNRGLVVDTTTSSPQAKTANSPLRIVSPIQHHDGKLVTHLLDKRRQKLAQLEQDLPKNAKPIEQETIIGVKSKLEPKRAITKSNLIEFLETKEVEQRVAASVVHQILLKEEEEQKMQEQRRQQEYKYREEPIFVHTEPKEDVGPVLSDYYETRPVSGGFKMKHSGSLKHGKMHAIRPPSRQQTIETSHENSQTAFIVNNQTLKPVIYFSKPVERPQTPLPMDMTRTAMTQRTRAKTPPPPALTRDVSYATLKPPSTAPMTFKEQHVKLPTRLAMDKSNLSHRMFQHNVKPAASAVYSPYPTISTLSSVVIPHTSSEPIDTSANQQQQQQPVYSVKVYKPYQSPMEKIYQPDLRKIVQQHLHARPKSPANNASISLKKNMLQPLLLQYEPVT